MEVNETRNCMVTDILLNIRRSAKWIRNGKTQQFNSGGVVKWAYFQKKWSIPLTAAQIEAACILSQLVNCTGNTLGLISTAW